MPLTFRADKRVVTLADPVLRLRREATDAERALWRRLRARQLAGAKFRRQHQLGPYILDFYCAELKLAIEIDGAQHYTEPHQARDLSRTRYLENQAIRVLRYSNLDVLTRLESVLQTIYLALGSDKEGPSP